MTTYDDAFVMKQGGEFVSYQMVGTNATFGIFRGVSTDGVTWDVSSTPVLVTGANGSWDSEAVYSPDVVWNGTGYLMYYTGDGAYSNTTFPANFRQIGVAFSSDGVHWTKYTDNPVVTHGPGTYDARYTRSPSVIFDNGIYKMWYTGTPPLSEIDTVGYIYSVEYATSADGVHWTKYPANPVFLGFKEGNLTYAGWPSVVEANGTYLMAFGDGSSIIGYATSSDGVSWKFDNASNVLVSLSGWHNGFVGFPSILIDGDRIHLWFTGTDNSSQTSPYTGGLGFAICGLALIPSPTVTTTTAISTETSVTTIATRAISTSISTSIVATTLVSTTVLNPSAPLFQVATAGLVGFMAALLIAVTLVWMKLRKKPKA